MEVQFVHLRVAGTGQALPPATGGALGPLTTRLHHHHHQRRRPDGNHQFAVLPASAAAQYGHTGAFGLSRPSSGHKAEHGDPSRGQPLWRHVREEDHLDVLQHDRKTGQTGSVPVCVCE